MYNHNKAQQSKNRVHISWDILYAENKTQNILIPPAGPPISTLRFLFDSSTTGI